MNAHDLESYDMDMVTVQRPVIDSQTGERTGWHDFQAPRHVAEKQLAREHKITGWIGARLKPGQEETGE